MKTNPRIRLSASVLNRAALIDACLREDGEQIFFYSPKHVRENLCDTPGYVIEGKDFVKTRAVVPRVNGNWTYETRRLLNKGMGYKRFSQWIAQEGIGVYVPYPFSELVGNKYETYRVVRGYHETLYPHCERYHHSRNLLENFLDSGSVFIKPRAGSKGDGIVNIKSNGSHLQLNYYESGNLKRVNVKDTAKVIETVKNLTKDGKGYVIQQAVETLRYDGSVFDIRVIMLFDGERWDWIHEARLSPKGSDVSNVSQGGISLVTEDLLFDLLGADATKQILDKIKSESFGLATYLDRLHPGDIMEIAFDFVIDTDMQLRLLEINTKPGLANIGFLRSIHDIKPEHEPFFERWIYPHTRSLANFLLRKQQEPY